MSFALRFFITEALTLAQLVVAHSAISPTLKTALETFIQAGITALNTV